MLSTFTKLITEDINNDSLYLIMMSRYFYDKLLLK